MFSMSAIISLPNMNDLDLKVSLGQMEIIMSIENAYTTIFDGYSKIFTVELGMTSTVTFRMGQGQMLI